MGSGVRTGESRLYDHLPDFDGHELLTVRLDRAGDLTAIIAIHNETRGPAIGGCRLLPYPSFEAAVVDALRLSRGMTYKTAIADIPYGGGKSVIVANTPIRDRQALLWAMADFVDSLSGRYITSIDSGTTLEDVRTMGQRTPYVAGTLDAAGDPSRSTADGIYACMSVAAEAVWGSQELAGRRVAIQGVGNVGARLARRLAAKGARLVIADADVARAQSIAQETGAEVIEPERVLFSDVDVLAPCALGAVLSADSIPRLKARVVVGGANNQLATPGDDERLRDAGVLYCPDYLANAGGIIDLHYQRAVWSRAAVDRHVAGLADTFREVLRRSRQLGLATGAVADAIANERFSGVPH